MKNRSFFVSLVIGTFLHGTTVLADGISFDRTRIIYQQEIKSESINLLNETDKLYLAQSSVVNTLDGIENSDFVVLPPLVRIEPRSRQSYKILFKNSNLLPKDRESLFFFSTYLIPESKKPNTTEDKVGIQFNVVTKMTIKFIYRPSGITSSVDEAGGQIQIKNHDGRLVLANPTPHVLTLIQLYLNKTKYPYADSIIIQPFSEVSLKQDISTQEVSWQIINDYGATSERYTKLLGK